MVKPTYKLTLSKPRQGLSPLAQAVLHLSEAAERLALEDRTLVNHIDGRAENVAEHSSMLTVIAPAIAEEYYPELDSNLVARYASIHDIVEAYVGDTPTHNITDEGLVSKQQLETEGLAKLVADFSALPSFVEKVESYEAQDVAEARFVRVLDKCMPHMLHFLDGGSVLRRSITKKDLLENSRERAARLRRDYPEFEQLIQLREELSERMADDFLG